MPSPTFDWSAEQCDPQRAAAKLIMRAQIYQTDDDRSDRKRGMANKQKTKIISR
jgi:ribosome biogenesis protein Tsr3